MGDLRVLVVGALAAVTAATPASAQITPISLAEAMTTARAHAPAVRAATARQEAGAARLDQAKGHRLPKVTVSETFVRTDSPVDVFAITLNQGRFSFGDFAASDPNAPDPISNFTTRFELTMPIFTGGELSSRIDQAALAAAAASDRATRAGDVAAAGAAEAWIRLAQARELVTLLETSLETVDRHVDVAAAYVEQGMLVRSELLRAQVERARLADELAAAHGQARTGNALLGFRLGLDQTVDRPLTVLEDPLPLTDPLADLLATAGERSDLTAARQLVEAAGLEATAHEAKRVPRVGLAARYDLNGEEIFGDDGDGASVLAFVSLDLFTGNRHRRAADAARAEAAAAAAEVSQFHDAIRLEVRQAWEAATVALERLATARTALDAAHEAERITSDRFEQGVIAMIDLLDASTARREAETRALVARADAHLARLALAAAAGRPPETILIAPTTNDDTGKPSPATGLAADIHPPVAAARPAPARTPNR